MMMKNLLTPILLNLPKTALIVIQRITLQLLNGIKNRFKHLQYTMGKAGEAGYCPQKECLSDVWAILILLDDMYNANGWNSSFALL
jgi:hypothetical protein